jgi:hypothetical protein
VCAANNNGTGYFFFEAFDEPWKVSDGRFGTWKRVMPCSNSLQNVTFGGVEAYWGLFNAEYVFSLILRSAFSQLLSANPSKLLPYRPVDRL